MTPLPDTNSEFAERGPPPDPRPVRTGERRFAPIDRLENDNIPDKSEVPSRRAFRAASPPQPKWFSDDPIAQLIPNPFSS